jgi:hypothetical protein
MLRFNANLFRIACACTSHEESRYYLRGVFVEPHAQGGVTLTATDGHRLISIRDEAGNADECAIITLGNAIKQCKEKRFARTVEIASGATEAVIYEETEDRAGVATATDVRVGGTYPDYRRAVPEAFTDKGAPAFDGSYLQSFAKIAEELAVHVGSPRSSSLRLACAANPPAVLVQFPRSEFAFGILMPLTTPTPPTLATPAWFRAEAVKQEAAE